MENYLLPVISFEPAVMERGKGSYVYDTEGKAYLDLNSGQFCTVLGHCNEEIMDAVRSSMEKLSHTGSNILAKPVVECAGKIHQISREMKAYSILLSTGAEAVEFAIRYGKHLKKKPGVICFDKGYHGLTLGTQSVTYSGKFAVPPVKEVYAVPVPDTFASREELEELVEQFEKLAARQGDNIALVLMEPVVSVGGMLFPDAWYFKQIRQICDRYGLLLVLDESQTGFGRLGTWFAYEQLEIVPDIVVLAKGIGQGYPVSMVLFREELVPEEGFAMTHYSSHQNDAFAASVVNAGIDYMEKYRVLEGIKEKGDYFLNSLQQLVRKNEHIVKARGHGLMLGAELNFEGVRNYRNIYHQIYTEMMHRGVMIQGTNGGMTLRFLPDYLIEKEAIDFALATLDEVLSDRNWSEWE